MTVTVLHGDCRDVLPTLAPGSVQCCVTSPPYFGLRDYGHEGQIGLEPSPDAYVAELVGVFREVRRVLRDDGVAFLNLGDSYNADGRKGRAHMGEGKNAGYSGWQNKTGFNTKPKDLLGIPWRVAFALQSDGWWLRSAIVWHKPNPMPESVTDRPTSSYEMVFLLAKSASYFYDADAVRESWADERAGSSGTKSLRYSEESGRNGDSGLGAHPPFNGRNARNVWTIATQPYSGSHFATMPPDLAERCIKAGSKPGDTILDPFFGAGTTGLVADRLGRHCVGIELNPAYGALAGQRIANDAGLFAEVHA